MVFKNVLFYFKMKSEHVLFLLVVFIYEVIISRQYNLGKLCLYGFVYYETFFPHTVMCCFILLLI